MKRFIVLLCLILLAVPAFAYYNYTSINEYNDKKDGIFQEDIFKTNAFNEYTKHKDIFKTEIHNEYTKKEDKSKTKNPDIEERQKRDYEYVRRCYLIIENNYDMTTYSDMKDSIALKYKHHYSMPKLDTDKSYYDANPKLEDIIKSRRIQYFGFEDIYPQYDKNGKLIKIGHKKVKYNKDGSLYKIGFFKVKYDGNIYWNGLNQIKINSFNEISSINNLDTIYTSKFKVYDTLELYEYYLKMLSDNFFNKYQYKIPRIKTYDYKINPSKKYDGFFDLEVDGNKDIINEKYECMVSFAHFFRIYLNYVYNPSNYDSLTTEEKTWFLEQVKLTEDWMKKHKVGYKNSYEEYFRKKPFTEVKSITEKPEFTNSYGVKSIHQIKRRSYMGQNKSHRSPYGSFHRHPHGYHHENINRHPHRHHHESFHRHHHGRL